MIAAYLLCLGIAGFLSFFETVNKFYSPKAPPPRTKYWIVVVLFCVLNGLLADLLLWLCQQLGWQQISKFSAPTLGILFGFGYLAIVRLKLINLETKTGEEVPVGVEYFYNLAKGFFHKRLDDTALDGLALDVDNLVARKTLGDLARVARLRIEKGKLLSKEEKAAKKAWLAGVLADTATEDEKKRAIAAFLLDSSD